MAFFFFLMCRLGNIQQFKVANFISLQRVRPSLNLFQKCSFDSQLKVQLYTCFCQLVLSIRFHTQLKQCSGPCFRNSF